MNTLEEKILKAINSEKSVDYAFDGEDEVGYDTLDAEAAAQSCTTIAIDFAKSFAEYTNKSDIVFIHKKDKWFNVFDNKTSYTSDQLIELYIQSL